MGFLASVAYLLADALFMQERDEEALQLTERWAPERLTVPEDAEAHIGWGRVRARLLARQGWFDDAERIGRKAIAVASGTDYLDARANAVADLAEGLRPAGRLKSRRLLEEAIRLCEATGNVAAAGALLHSARRAADRALKRGNRRRTLPGLAAERRPRLSARASTEA